MLTRRWGTLILGVVWLGSWGLVFVHPVIIALPVTATTAIGGLWPIIRLWDGYNSGDLSRRFVLLPFLSRDVRHNTRGRLLRKVEKLEEKQRLCDELMESLDDPQRVIVLEAERDAAQREQSRLEDDIERLEASWEVEDRERAYKRITGG